MSKKLFSLAPLLAIAVIAPLIQAALSAAAFKLPWR